MDQAGGVTPMHLTPHDISSYAHLCALDYATGLNTDALGFVMLFIKW